MGKHLQRDLDLIKKEILTMGSMVEEAINKAITALLQRRADLAAEVLAGDDEIDEQENTVEDHCLKTLALHQPVASDLRFVVTALKVNNDLERMGDLAANIAERTRDLLQNEPLNVDVPIAAMGEAVRKMVRQSLDSLVELDAELAREVCREDDKIDTFYRQMFGVLQQRMREEPASIERAVEILSISRYLERIADHATNVAEDLVFLVEGEVIRHLPEDQI